MEERDHDDGGGGDAMALEPLHAARGRLHTRQALTDW